MDIISILRLFGGIGLFIYGMSLMSSSMEKLAGSGLERVLSRVTTSKKKGVGAIKGWIFGMGVTAIIQNSAATTIMLIGFANAGLLKVTQAIPVVFGANVGSTVTAQILRLGDLGDDNIVLELLKPSSFAPILVAIGAVITLFIKKKGPKDVARILVGLGLLFYGMTMMEDVFEPLHSNEVFQSFFTSFTNPVVGILTGIVITIILQSSNASVGILQALSATGTVSYAVAVPIILGENIGKCSTTLIGGIGANKNSKRLVVSYVFFNVFGVIFFGGIIYLINAAVGIPLFEKIVNRSDIATVHLLFNFLTSLVLLPFSKQISKFATKIVGEEEEKETDKELAKLDDMLLNTPATALNQCRHLINRMGDTIIENYNVATDMIYNYDESKFALLEENESFIDKCESVLSPYVMRIDRKRLPEDDRRMVVEILNSISDFERMGDYCMGIAYTAKDKNEKGIHFSPAGHREVESIVAATKYTLESTVKAFKEDDATLSIRIEPLSETIDKLKEIMKSQHVERLQTGECGIEGGIELMELITGFERIASHCSNIALHIIKRVGGDKDFDEMHGHTADASSEEYKALYLYYEAQYVRPILSKKPEKQAKPAKAERAEKTEKVQKPDKTDKVQKPDKTEKVQKSDKVEKPDKAERTEKAEKTEKQSKKDKSVKGDKGGKSDKSEKTEKQVKTEKPEKAEKQVKTEKSEKPEKIEKPEKSDKSEKQNKVNKGDKPSKKSAEKQDKSGKSDKTDKSDKADKKSSDKKQK